MKEKCFCLRETRQKSRTEIYIWAPRAFSKLEATRLWNNSRKNKEQEQNKKAIQFSKNQVNKVMHRLSNIQL